MDLVVRSIPRAALHASKPFSVACTLAVAASVREGQQRTLTLAVQHVQQPPSARPTPSGKTAPPVPGTTTTTTTTAATAATHARLASAVATAIASSIAPRAPSAALGGSPRATQLAEQEVEEDPLARALRRIPPPEPMPGDEARYEKLRGATRFLGASTLLVPPMTLVRAATAGSGSESESESESSAPGGGGGDATTGGAGPRREEQFWDFELEYTPLRTGFAPVGGLRVLLVEDRVHATEDVHPERRTTGPVVLKEWDVVGEIWVKS